MLDAALSYRRRGLSVLPLHTVRAGHCTCGNVKCIKAGKHPRIPWRRLEDTPLTEADIERYWSMWPDANVGIVAGETSGVAVIDIDGMDGLASLDAIGMAVDTLPPTPTVRTGGGGLHLYARYQPGVSTRAAILDHVDIRSDGGMVVAPPSMHKSGEPYMWVPGRSLKDLDPADIDLLALVHAADAGQRARVRRLTWYEEMLAGVGEGERNDAATRLAGRYTALGLSEAETAFLLGAWNARNSPAMPDSEIQSVVRSIRRRDHAARMPREEALSLASSLIGLRVNEIYRTTGEPPEYMLEFDGGNCYLSPGDLLAPDRFQRAVLEATNCVIKALSKKGHPSHSTLSTAVSDAAIEIESGDQSTLVGTIALLTRELLAAQRTMPEAAAPDIPARGAFRNGGRIWIDLSDLIQMSGVRLGERLTIRQVAQRMPFMGFTRQTFEGHDVRRALWGVPSEYARLVVPDAKA